MALPDFKTYSVNDLNAALVAIERERLRRSVFDSLGTQVRAGVEAAKAQGVEQQELCDYFGSVIGDVYYVEPEPAPAEEQPTDPTP